MTGKLKDMGNMLQRFDIELKPRVSQHRDTNRIPIHRKCRNCGRQCESSGSTTASCPFATYTRTGTAEQPAVIRAIVPDDKVRWATAFDYRPIDFTSEKVRSSKKDYVDRDPRVHANVNIPWNEEDEGCDRRSYHGSYRIVGNLPQNPCGRTGLTGRGHLGKE